jgi:hypothetical protein
MQIGFQITTVWWQPKIYYRSNGKKQVWTNAGSKINGIIAAVLGTGHEGIRHWDGTYKVLLRHPNA